MTNDVDTTVSVGPAGVRVAVGSAVRAPFERCRPWFTIGAIEWLETNLPPGLVGVEYGGGGSTPWWCERLAKLYTVEANPKWALAILNHMRNHPDLLVRWRMQFVPANWHRVDGGFKFKNEFARQPDLITDDIAEDMEADYLRPPLDHADLVVIDGAIRYETVKMVGQWVRESPIRFVVVDNTESALTSRACDDSFSDLFVRHDFEEVRPEFIPSHQSAAMTSVFTRTSDPINVGENGHGEVHDHGER